MRTFEPIASEWTPAPGDVPLRGGCTGLFAGLAAGRRGAETRPGTTASIPNSRSPVPDLHQERRVASCQDPRSEAAAPGGSWRSSRSSCSARRQGGSPVVAEPGCRRARRRGPLGLRSGRLGAVGPAGPPAPEARPPTTRRPYNWPPDDGPAGPDPAAIATYSRLELKRMTAEDYFLLGRALSRTGQDDLALKSLEAARDADPDRPETLDELAQVYFRKDRPAAAEVLARQTPPRAGLGGPGAIDAGDVPRGPARSGRGGAGPATGLRARPEGQGRRAPSGGSAPAAPGAIVAPVGASGRGAARARGDPGLRDRIPSPPGS